MSMLQKSFQLDLIKLQYLLFAVSCSTPSRPQSNQFRSVRGNMTCFPCFGSWKQYYKGKEKLANAVTEMGANAGHTLHSVRSAPKNSSEPQFDPHVQSDDIAQTFTYRELAAATKNFRDDYFIGQGGFGSVYQGKLITGQAVAVKKLDPTSHQGDREFLVEVLMLSFLRHPNLVNLIGYCAEGTQRLLVYEHMAFGSLEFHLHGRSPDEEPLDWNTRMMIAAGAAKGLNYLHNEAYPPVIYRDLKSANILLTNEFFPKLSDFGLAKFGPSGDKSHVSTRVMGTFGYCAPEYMETGKLTLKSDIYSFGVLLLELITGRKAMDLERGLEKELVRWARLLLGDRSKYSVLVDPKLQGQISESSLAKVIQVTSMCLREEANTRPQIGNVMKALDNIVSRLHKPKQAPKMNRGGQENGDSTKEASLMRNPDRAQAVAEESCTGCRSSICRPTRRSTKQNFSF